MTRGWSITQLAASVVTYNTTRQADALSHSLIDVYVTGDLKYHEADAAQERGLALIDAGHDGTERNIATAIARHLRKAVPGLVTKAFIEPEIFQPVFLR